MRFAGCIVFGVIGCVSPDSETLSSTSQALDTFAPTLLAMAPVGYWRFGEPMGSPGPVDSGPNHIDGTYFNGPGLNQMDMVGGDPNTAMLTQSFFQSHARIPDHKLLSLTRTWDIFNRTVSESISWGTSSGGEAWAPQVSVGSYYSVNGSTAIINPHGTSGTFQQGQPTTTLLSGDMQVRATWSTRPTTGTLQAVSLVAHYTTNGSFQNFVRAELRENSNHTMDLIIVQFKNNVSVTLASTMNIGTNNQGDWWYVRFQFDGPVYRARAWKKGTIQPIDTYKNTAAWDCLPIAPGTGAPCVNATASEYWSGSTGLRTSNSQSNVRPIVSFESFWVQTLGLSVHLGLKIGDQQVDDQGHGIYLWGKGNCTDSELLCGQGNREYLLRYHPNGQYEKDGNPHLRAYVNDWHGGLGSGIDMSVCSNPALCPISPGPWHQLVIQYDSGDALDTEAGIGVYVDGHTSSAMQPGVASTYNSSSCCVDAVDGLAGPTFPGVPGTCSWETNSCPVKPACKRDCTPPNLPCGDHEGTCVGGFCTHTTCWNVYPMSGNAPLGVGVRDDDGSELFFTGWFDEMALFSRKLTEPEITNLWEKVQPIGQP